MRVGTRAAPAATDAEDAPAKVNLYLHVTGRRGDGYHLLDSLVVFVEAADRVTVRPARAGTLSVAVTGPFAAAIADEPDNLVLRAARLLAQTTPRVTGVAITLEKNLPVASGLGGGSADAAATLRLLRRFWRLDLADAALMELALTLGADVPACLAARTLRMGGIGEVLGRAPRLPRRIGLVLANPGIGVSTPDVFRRRKGAFSRTPSLPQGWPDTATMADDLMRVGNDLEGPARTLCPAVDTALAWVRSRRGCLMARMSGAGATCFGLWRSPEAARQAVAAAPWPAGWWVWAGGVRGAVDAGLVAAY